MTDKSLDDLWKSFDNSLLPYDNDTQFESMEFALQDYVMSLKDLPGDRFDCGFITLDDAVKVMTYESEKYRKIDDAWYGDIDNCFLRDLRSLVKWEQNVNGNKDVYALTLRLINFVDHIRGIMERG